jgi:hypothetical protein
VSTTDEDYNSLIFAAVRVPYTPKAESGASVPPEQTAALYSMRGMGQPFQVQTCTS